MAGQHLPFRADLFALRAGRLAAAWCRSRRLPRRAPRAALPSLVRRWLRPGAERRALPYVPKEPVFMTDIRRTILWMVFTMSLVFLWDAWNKHTGQPSWFSPAPPRPAATAPANGPATAGSAVADVGQSQAGVPTAATPAPAATPTSGPAPAATSKGDGEQTVVTTDRVRATFDSVGGSLVRLELLNHADTEDDRRRVVLFDRSAERVYKAQSGLITAQPGVALPNHWSPMKRVDGPTALADGSNELPVRFESVGEGGVKLVKTYTFGRGSYVIGVRHEIVNSGAAPVKPELYLGL